MIMPALAALLTHAAIQVLRNLCPFLRSVSNYKLEHTPVFLGSPGTFYVES